jgi:hypothetical protein
MKEKNVKKEQLQLLRDANIEPTAEKIASGLGSANNTYKKFIEKLKEYNISLMDWRYYNDGKAWLSKGEYKWVTSRGTNKVKPIFWLSIWEGFFKVSFFFSEKTRKELLALSISDETREIIKRANVNGKTMRFLSIILDISHDEQLADVYTLAKFRKENI